MAHEAGAEGPTRGMSKMFKTKLFCKHALAANRTHEAFKYVPMTPPVTARQAALRATMSVHAAGLV